MFTKKVLAAAAVLVAFAGLGTSQMITLRGKVENDKAGRIIVDCTQVHLSSRAVNLNLLVGKQVLIKGKVLSTTPVPVVDVASAQMVKRTFEIGGNGKIGREFSIQVEHTPKTMFWIWLSRINAFQPAGMFGTLLIKPILSFRAGSVPSTGVYQEKLPIPNDPALVGLTLFGQAVLVPPGIGAAPFLSNPDCGQVKSR